MLSFGDEAMEEEIQLTKANPKIQSSHDLLNDEKLSKVAVKPAASGSSSKTSAEAPEPKVSFRFLSSANVAVT